MFERILIPVEGGDRDKATIDAAATLGETFGATLTLLHVIETVENIPFEELKDFYDRLQLDTEKRLTSLQTPLGSRGIETRRAIVYGRRLEQIIQFAREDNSSLILMTSHRVTSERPEVGWDSLSHSIAVLSPCPVLLVK